MMEASCASETSKNSYQTTCRNISEDSNHLLLRLSFTFKSSAIHLFSSLSVVLPGGKRLIRRPSNFSLGCKENEIHKGSEILSEGEIYLSYFYKHFVVSLGR